MSSLNLIAAQITALSVAVANQLATLTLQIAA